MSVVNNFQTNTSIEASMDSGRGYMYAETKAPKGTLTFYSCSKAR